MIEPDFRKKLFRSKMPEIYWKNQLFGISSRFIHYFFLTFCSKMRFSNAQNMAESDFREKIFSGRKCRKYAGNRRFCRFSLDFFYIFRCFFSHKNISDIAFSFVRSFVRSRARSYFHYQVGPISMLLVPIEIHFHVS